MERGWEEVGPTAESGGGVPEGLEPPARFLCAASSAASMLGGRGHRLSLSLAFSQPPLPPSSRWPSRGGSSQRQPRCSCSAVGAALGELLCQAEGSHALTTDAPPPQPTAPLEEQARAAAGRASRAAPRTLRLRLPPLLLRDRAHAIGRAPPPRRHRGGAAAKMEGGLRDVPHRGIAGVKVTGKMTMRCWQMRGGERKSNCYYQPSR